MTDRVRHLTVILDQDYRDEEEGVGVITNAIRMIKGVSSVETGDSVDHVQISARDEFRFERGMMIAEMAQCQDSEFDADVVAAYAKMKKKRGY